MFLCPAVRAFSMYSKCFFFNEVFWKCTYGVLSFIALYDKVRDVPGFFLATGQDTFSATVLRTEAVNISFFFSAMHRQKIGVYTQRDKLA